MIASETSYPNALLSRAAAAVPYLADAARPSNLQEAQDAFVNDPSLAAPPYVYPGLATIDFGRSEEELVYVSTQLAALQYPSEAIGALYRRALDTKRAELEQLRTMAQVHAVDDTGKPLRGPVEKQDLRAPLLALTEKIDGHFRDGHFNTFLRELHERLTAEPGDDLRTRRLKRALADMLPEPDGSEVLYRPTDDEILAVRGVGKAIFARFRRRIAKENDLFTDEDIAATFQDIIDTALPTMQRGWTASVADVTNISVHDQLRSVLIPSSRETNRKGLARIVTHEMTHLLRTMLGELSGMLPLVMGTPGSMDFEEGVASMFEQALEGRYEDVGTNAYLANGLLRKGYTFRDVYNAMRLYNALDSRPEAHGGPSKRALNLVTRATRGTGFVPHNKDLSYVNGLSTAWNYTIQTLDRPAERALIFAGRADPTRPDDAAVLAELARLPRVGRGLLKYIK